MVSYSASLIARFPDEEVDEEVMIALLDVIANSITRSRTLTKFISEEGALNKIAVQLTIVLEELNQGTQKFQEDELKLQLQIFDKLILAIINVAKDYKPAKSAMLQVNLFTPLLVYLARAESQFDTEPFYSEERVMSALNLLS